eukprot:m.6016 g.6016  ORF g.6016 m.6016 type:complete len:64 (+) comp4668_c0_seq2:1504-1695(+)
MVMGRPPSMVHTESLEPVCLFVSDLNFSIFLFVVFAFGVCLSEYNCRTLQVSALFSSLFFCLS